MRGGSSLRQLLGMWGFLLKNRKFVVGFIIVVVIALLGIIGPFVTPDPLEYHWNERGLPPLTGGHLLGTTAPWGQDVFAQLCTGIRNSLFVGVLSGGLGTLIAVLLGALGAYKGGLADASSNFVTNIVMVFPIYPALLVLSAAVGREGRSVFLVAFLIAVTSWPWAARTIRSQILSLKEREFVNLARMSGMPSREIVIKEILPNMLAYITMVFVLLAGGAMLAETGVSLLGVGPIPQYNITLGSMLYNCISNTVASWRDLWWWYVPPGIVLTLLLSAIFVMHAGMDEIFNPKLRRA
ncbi:MAG: ABC transporter permease [Thermoproteota archaeon]